MRTDRRRPLAALFLACCHGAALAGTGLDFAVDAEREEYAFTAGSAVVDWQRFTLTPWWSNDRWRVAAEIPYLMRDASATGTVLVWRRVDGAWVQVPLVIDATQSDSGLGDARVSVTHAWQPSPRLQPYVTTELKLPTGDADTSDATFTFSVDGDVGTREGSGAFTFGNDSTDLRLAPGLTVRDELVWTTVELSHTWTDDGDIPVSDFLGAYAGIGFTPLPWLELAAEFDFEDATDGTGDPLEQWTWSLSLYPNERYTITLSTFDRNDASSLDGNWTLGASARL